MVHPAPPAARGRPRPRAARLLAAAVLALLGVLAFAGPASAAAAGEAVRGTLRNGEDAVAGVDITVTTADGQDVGTATTGDDGTFEISLPGPGDYQATLDTDTLPEGVALTDEERATLTFAIRTGQSRPLLYALGEGSAAEDNPGQRALQLLVEGIKFGLIIAMSAIGLSLIFGTTGLTNFAHGELVTLGALIAWFINVRLGLHLVPAALLAIALGALAGALQDRGLWRPLRRRGTGLIAMLVISIGVGILARYVFLYLFGGRTRPFQQYGVQRAYDLGPVSIAPKDLVSIALSVAVLIGVAYVLQRTKIGKAMRAVADNGDLAASSGIDVEKVISFVWLFGGALATLGGILFGLTEQVSFQMGFQLLLLMFAGVTLGGLGTAYGPLLGGLVVGIFVQMSTLVISTELKNVGALLVLVLILLVRPQGLLGSPERIG